MILLDWKVQLLLGEISANIKQALAIRM